MEEKRKGLKTAKIARLEKIARRIYSCGDQIPVEGVSKERFEDAYDYTLRIGRAAQRLKYWSPQMINIRGYKEIFAVHKQAATEIEKRSIEGLEKNGSYAAFFGGMDNAQ
ncbi:MAG: hypothetical protein V1887_02920 [Candidatus Aenigmatarchaeota archaeon]